LTALANSFYDVSPDGQRFLFVKANTENGPTGEVRVILNWTESGGRKWMTLRPGSLYEFAGLPVRPRVVGQSKLDAIREGRVVVKQEHVHGIRVRVA
jgi:hypothetical protein